MSVLTSSDGLVVPGRRVAVPWGPCSGSRASSSATPGATRNSFPRCSVSSPTANHGPSCGSAPIRAGRQRSPTGGRWATSPASSRTCSRSSPPPNRSRYRHILTPNGPATATSEGSTPDPHPKPELLCALTEFDALCGIRPVEATMALLGELGADGCLTDVLASDGPDRRADGALQRHASSHDPSSKRCATSGRDEAAWVGRLAERYPDDPSVVATLLMNLVRLTPGEAPRLGRRKRPCISRMERRSS